MGKRAPAHDWNGTRCVVCGVRRGAGPRYFWELPDVRGDRKPTKAPPPCVPLPGDAFVFVVRDGGAALRFRVTGRTRRGIMLHREMCGEYVFASRSGEALDGRLTASVLTGEIAEGGGKRRALTRRVALWRLPPAELARAREAVGLPPSP